MIFFNSIKISSCVANFMYITSSEWPWFVRSDCFCKLRQVVKLLTVYKGPPWHTCKDLTPEDRVRVPASLEIQDKFNFFQSRGSGVGIATMLLTRLYGVRISVAKEVFIFSKSPNRLWVPKWVSGFLP